MQTTDLGWLSASGLSDAERESMLTLLGPSTDIEQFTVSMGPEELWNALTCSVRIYADAKQAQGMLKPIIGKLLLAVQSHPDLWRSKGYLSYDDFITRGCRELFGLARSEAYRAKRLFENWSSLSPQDFATIGEGKLYALSGFTNSRDPASTGWLEIARNSTLDQLKDEIVRKGESTQDDLTPAQISFVTTLGVKKAWVQFVANPDVQSVVGSEDIGTILSAMIGDFSSTFGI